MRTTQRAALLCLASASLALSQSGQASGAPADLLSSSSSSVEQLGKRQQVVFSTQEPVSVERNPPAASSNGLEDAWHEVYHDYEGVQAHLEELASRYSDFATVIELGRTWENRSISALKLSLPASNSSSSNRRSPSFLRRKLWRNLRWPWESPPQDGEPDDSEQEKKLGLVIAAGAHAREWISSASSLYFAEKVLSRASEYQPPQEEPSPAPPAVGRRESKHVHWSRQSWSQLFSRDAQGRRMRRRGKGHAKGKKHHKKGSAHTKGRKKKSKAGRKHRDSERHSSPLSPSQAYELLEKFSITLVPLSNPDGYAYTWQEGGNRLWRKNRQPAEGAEDAAECVGIDVNRNWDFGFNTSPYPAPDPCSESYAGVKPFEALETEALSRYMLDETNNIKLFFDLHSYGQHIMYPFAKSCDQPLPDEEDLAEVALGSAKALRDLHKTSFSTGRICELLFSNWGSSIDWSYAVGNIKWSFAVELRDAGTYGFLLPADQIKPSGEELTSLLNYMLTFIAKKEK